MIKHILKPPFVTTEARQKWVFLLAPRTLGQL